MPAGRISAPVNRRIVASFGRREGENLPVRHNLDENLKSGGCIFLASLAIAQDNSKSINHLILNVSFDFRPTMSR
jgi:hypothetical protein